MEQDFDADPSSLEDDSPSQGLAQGLKDALSHILGGTFSNPRPPSSSLDDAKRKASRPTSVLPRLLRKAPAGLTANLKGLRSVDTDEEDVDAADMAPSLGTSPSFKRTGSFLQAPPTLTPESQCLIFRLKSKPARASNPDGDVWVPPPSPPRTALSSNGTPGSLSRGPLETPAAGGGGGGLVAVHSTYSVARRTSSCRFSEGLASSVIESLQQDSHSQQQPQQPQYQQQRQLLQSQPFQAPQPPPLQQRPQSQGGPRLARQNQPLVPSSQLYSSMDFDRTADVPHGIKVSSVIYDVRASSPGARSRSSTPTNRAVHSSQSRRVSQGYLGGTPTLGSGGGGSGTPVAAGFGGAPGAGASPFGTANGLMAAAAAGSTGGGGAAAAGSSGFISSAISAPVAVSGSPASYILGGGGGSSGGGGGNGSVRSPLTSPLSAPPPAGAAKPALFRTTFAAAPLSPKSGSPVPPGVAPPPTPPSLHHVAVSANAVAAAAHGEPAAAHAGGGAYGSGSIRGASRRFGTQVAPAAGTLAATSSFKSVGGGSVAAAAGLSAVMDRGSCGGSGPLQLSRLLAPSTLGHSFSSGSSRPPLGLWPPAGGAGGGWGGGSSAGAVARTGATGSGGGGGPDHGADGDDELSVVRRSASASATAVAVRNLVIGASDVSEGNGSGAASPGLFLDDISDSETGDEGSAGGGERAASCEEAGADAGGEASRRAAAAAAAAGGNMGELLTAFTEEHPLSTAARQLAALHRAKERARERRTVAKGKKNGDKGSSSRWRAQL